MPATCPPTAVPSVPTGNSQMFTPQDRGTSGHPRDRRISADPLSTIPSVWFCFSSAPAYVDRRCAFQRPVCTHPLALPGQSGCWLVSHHVLPFTRWSHQVLDLGVPVILVVESNHKSTSLFLGYPGQKSPSATRPRAEQVCPHLCTHCLRFFLCLFIQVHPRHHPPTHTHTHRAMVEMVYAYMHSFNKHSLVPPIFMVITWRSIGLIPVFK